MDEEWIWFWFRCLRLNKPYKEYCDLRRDGDASREQAKLEKQYPKIVEIYEDFGDIHTFKVLGGTNYDNWLDWLDKHRHLFLVSTELETVLIKEPIAELSADFLYIKVPVDQQREDAIEAVATIVSDYHENHKTKYQLLHNKPGPKALSTLRRQLNVWHRRHPTDGEPITHEALAELLVSGKVGRADEWAWKPHKPGSKIDWKWSKEYVDEHGNMANLTRAVQRYDAEADQIIANTVHGVFPVDKVLD